MDTRYNTHQSRVDLDNEINRLNASLDEHSARINEMRSSDDRSKWGKRFDEVQALYNHDYFNLTRLIDERRNLKPLAPNAEARANARRRLERDPIARFVMAAANTGDGMQGLEAHEIQASKEEHEKQSSNGSKAFGSTRDLVINIKNAVLNPTNTLTTTGAGSIIETDTVTKIAEVLQKSTGVLAASQVVMTPDARPIQFPNSDQTAEVGERLSSEGTEIASGDLQNFGHTEVGGYTYSSKKMSVSKEAIQDSNIDLVQYHIQRGVRRIVRAWGSDFTNGTGSSQPFGVVPSAGTGVTMATGTGAQAIALADLYSIYFDIDAAYLDGAEGIDGGAMGLSGGRTGFMMSRAVYSKIIQLKDGDGRPIFMPGQTTLGGGVMPMQIFGLPIFLNYWMDSNLTAGAKKSVLFGNFSEHLIRIADAIRIRAFDGSPEAERNEVAVFGFGRATSAMVGHGATSQSYKVLASKA